MTVSIIVPGAQFSKYGRSVLLPHLEEAEGYYLFGGSAASSTKNRALAGRPDATPIGSPGYSAAYASLSTLVGFDLGFVNQRIQTKVVVARWLAGNTGLIGHWPGGATDQDDLLYIVSGALREIVSGNQAGHLVSAPVGGFVFYASTYDGATKRVYAHDGTSMLTASTSVANTTPPVNTLKVGGNTFQAVSSFDAAAAAVYSAALSSAQISDVYAYLKAKLATRGVAVT